ncbi:MAG TPA: alpha/beta hydrolase [Pyrinomonadaceae bacterium]|nr:alpha/beta hydrolase [Pyrinomonadaceae bacterium]
MPKVPIDGFQLYYESEGDGEPLVLIPGFASGRSLWSRQVGPLARHFRVISFDPRGVAQSDKPDGPQTISLLADDVAALLTLLGIESAHIAGVSFGGFVAQEFALRHPGRLRRLVLCCTSFGGPNHVVPAPEIMTEIMQPRAAGDVSEDMYRVQLQAAVRFNTEDRLAEISSPTLIVSGDADAIVPVQNSYNLARQIPNAELRLVSGGSHTFFMEQQADEFNQVVTEWLLRK